MKKIFTNPDHQFYLLICIYLISHFYGITDPPSGFHQWRESDTAAVSEAFYKETLDFFHPLTHQRKDKVGITGMEFPVYNYSVGLLYRVMGFHHWIPRLLTILIAGIGLLGIFRLAEFMFEKKIAVLSVFMVICTPLFFFYSRKIQPDMILFSAIIWGFYLFLKSEKEQSTGLLLGSAVIIMLGALIKPTGLFIGVPLLYIILKNNSRNGFQSVFKFKYFLFALITVIPVLSWNMYSNYLKSEYGLDVFFTGGNIIEYWKSTDWSGFFGRIFTSWLFEMFIGIPSVIGLVVGFIVSVKKDLSLQVFGWWIGGCYVIFFAVAQHMATYHDYYGIITVPAFSILSAYFINELFKKGKWFSYFGWFVLFAAAVNVFPRIDQRYGDSTQEQFESVRNQFDKIIPKNERIAIEDETPAIELYKAGRFGWTFSKSATDSVILSQINSGAGYAVFYKREISENLGRQLVEVYSDSTMKIVKKNGNE